MLDMMKFAKLSSFISKILSLLLEMSNAKIISFHFINSLIFINLQKIVFYTSINYSEYAVNCSDTFEYYCTIHLKMKG